MEASFTTSSLNTESKPLGLTVRQSWYLVGMLFVWQLAAALPFGVVEGLGKVLNFSVPKVVSLTAMYALAFGLTIWGALRKPSAQPLSFAPIKPVVYPIIGIATIAFALLLEPLTSALPVPGWLQKILEQTFTKDAIWSAVLLAPVLEEILFRGIILDGLLKRYSPTKAIIWSAILFGVVHLNPAQSTLAFLIGLPLGWLYYRTGSLLPCIALHFVNNSLGSLPLLTSNSLDMSANPTQVFIGNDGVYEGVLVGCAVVCFAAYRWLDRLLPNPAR